jgi:hypothetical protein
VTGAASGDAASAADAPDAALRRAWTRAMRAGWLMAAFTLAGQLILIVSLWMGWRAAARVGGLVHGAGGVMAVVFAVLVFRLRIPEEKR